MLKNNLWTNPNEIPRNGIDDDKNDYIDDIHGWNFAHNKASVQDLHGHGTHIAGIVAQNSPTSKLMILKYFDPNSSAEKNLASTIAAIKYATQMGAQIINYSAGGPGFNAQEEQAIREAEEKNILLVAAAGNDSKNTDASKYYPANYPLTNIISVLSTDSKRQLSSFTNYGPASIDIATLGEDILSAAPNNQMTKMSGSSQATALITAAAANLLSVSNGAWIEEISSRIKQSGETLVSLKNKSKYEKYFDSKLLDSVKSSNESAFGERWANIVDIPLSEVLVPAP